MARPGGSPGFRSRDICRIGAGALGVGAVAISLKGGAGVVALALLASAAALWIGSVATPRTRPRRDHPLRPDGGGLLASIFASRPPAMDRRAVLRLFGMSALFATPLKVVPQILERASRSAGPSATSASMELAQEGVVTARLRQWTMIIDLRRCDGCQRVGTPPQCTTACIEGHFAPEPMQWIEVFEDEVEGEGTRFVPTPCQHCQNPPCVNVCPVGATFSSPEGLVLIDQDRCIGCRICMAACPYDRRFFNWGDPPIPPEAVHAHYDLETQVPALKGTVMKCDFCPDMVRAGTLPYCLQACPNDAIYYGDLEEDLATNGVSLVEASKFLAEHNATRLKEELGTQPRVFYIPGHGEEVGRDPSHEGRLPAIWPWQEHVEGSVTWSR